MALSTTTQVNSITSLSSDLFYDILRRLDGPTLASAACACAAFCSISREERLWENVCSSLWPSTNREEVKSLISSIGGFRKFYADCFPLIVNKEVPDYQWNEYLEYNEEWNEADYYGDVDELESISPSDFISLVDVRFKDQIIFSKVLWGIPNANGFNGWFYNCPFRVDLLSFSSRDDDDDDDGDGNENEITLTVSDGLPPITSMERERKDGKLWRELKDGLRLSWIVVNQKVKQAANLASWSSLGGQRHWPTDRDFVVRFGSVLPAKDILPCQVVECILSMKFRVVSTEGDDSQTSLKLTELSMQLEDMEGAHVNGRNSLLILKEALSCHRSKDYSEALESCHLYSKVQSELKEEKMRIENRLDRLCIFSGIAAFATLWYYCIM
ncbi:F-box protein At2g27310-like [Punica granatum]|uniref:F-box protein At2g27310-like n=1 Tax=Punica granatum TaxID=22663 RepID=A0A6P8EMU9_PUNGR|nr:F-box protein At2g27310-like [Punica granatum]XP_031407845.1 F-box protein At2g27310-like [Punica granatum]